MKIINSEKSKGKWFCIECGRPINNGFSYHGYCVVCAEKYLNPEATTGINHRSPT